MASAAASIFLAKEAKSCSTWLDVDARAAALYARGERFVHLLDALVDLVEALAAARFRRDVVELGGEIFEPALEGGEGAADLGRDDRANAVDELAHILGRRDIGAGGAQLVDLRGQRGDAGLELLDRQRATRDRLQQLVNLARLAGDLVERGAIGAAVGVMLGELVAERAHFLIEDGDDAARIELAQDRAQIGGEPLDRRQHHILDAIEALRLDALGRARAAPVSTAATEARGARSTSARESALEIAAQKIDLGDDGRLLLALDALLGAGRGELPRQRFDRFGEAVEDRRPRFDG